MSVLENLILKLIRLVDLDSPISEDDLDCLRLLKLITMEFRRIYRIFDPAIFDTMIMG